MDAPAIPTPPSRAALALPWLSLPNPLTNSVSSSICFVMDVCRVSARFPTSTTCKRTRSICCRFPATCYASFVVASDNFCNSFCTCRLKAVIDASDWLRMAAISLPMRALTRARRKWPNDCRPA